MTKQDKNIEKSSVSITADWIEPKYDKKGNFLYHRIGNTYDLELRIIKELKLTKYDGILMQDNSPLKEELVDPVFRIMRRESKGALSISISMAKEVASRVKAVVASPIDDRSIISFNNTTIDFYETRKAGKLVFKPHKDNHNAVQWSFMTPAEIKASPKHKEMSDYMIKMIRSWKIDEMLLFKIGAYAMIKENFADKVFIFKGKGGEGKGTANEMIRALFAPSASKSYDPINIKLGSEMAFVGSQIVFNDDLDDGHIKLTHIKPVATGGELGVRPLYQGERTIRPYSTMIFNTNHDVKVGVNAVSKAWEDRQFVVEFRGPNFRGTEAAKEFKKLRPFENKYFMDVFASCCAMVIPQLIEEEFNDVKSKLSQETTASIKDNVVKKFIDDLPYEELYWDRKASANLPLPVRDGYVTMMELYGYFSNWADENGEKFKPNKSEFKKQFSHISGINLDVDVPTYKSGKMGRWIDISSLLEVKEEEDHKEFTDVLPWDEC